MKFKEIYCNNCKKVLGRYNVKFYNADKIGEALKINHVEHIRNGHQIKIRYVQN